MEGHREWSQSGTKVDHIRHQSLEIEGGIDECTTTRHHPSRLIQPGEACIDVASLHRAIGVGLGGDFYIEKWSKRLPGTERERRLGKRKTKDQVPEREQIGCRSGDCQLGRLDLEYGPRRRCEERTINVCSIRISFSILAMDEPYGKAHASSAFFFHSMPFFLISFPFSPFINSITSFATSSLFTLLSISIATPHLLQHIQQFVCWSPKNGQHIIGTPLEILSIVEFHPLCIQRANSVARRKYRRKGVENVGFEFMIRVENDGGSRFRSLYLSSKEFNHVFITRALEGCQEWSRSRRKGSHVGRRSPEIGGGIRRDKLRVQDFEPPAPASLVGLEQVDETGAGMLSKMFNFSTGGPTTELLENQINYQHHRNQRPNSATGDWYGNNTAQAITQISFLTIFFSPSSPPEFFNFFFNTSHVVAKRCPIFHFHPSSSTDVK
ncbi:hypothetical protein Ccrd_024999 [Cynara cardunculus var. scolymus]|uniref:Uncharacterized protein n=1 Tax=Cynara cardunculus var. scolymus TaxID=59895 RepID=A0A118JRT4_CYNCS|nr:hypothetical protein Ccrd_024999 [Cynara cardunculus var. scolymus]